MSLDGHRPGDDGHTHWEWKLHRPVYLDNLSPSYQCPEMPPPLLPGWTSGMGGISFNTVAAANKADDVQHQQQVEESGT